MNTTQSTDRTAILALRPDVVATVLEDGAVLLDLENKYFYALNASAWALAQCFEAGASENDVAAHALTLGAPDDGGARAFIESLHAYGLLEAGAEAGLPDATPATLAWSAPTIERQAEPLQKVLVSAFDPSIPLAE